MKQNAIAASAIFRCSARPVIQSDKADEDLLIKAGFAGARRQRSHSPHAISDVPRKRLCGMKVVVVIRRKLRTMFAIPPRLSAEGRAWRYCKL
jgi:hypothetical protein